MAENVGTDVDHAAAMIREGGLVAFPTETVYGLGANALNPTAVAKIFEAKARPHFDPLIVHGNAIPTLKSLVADWPDVADTLTDAFWPGPLTLVLSKTESVPDLVTSGLPNVAVRLPRHPIAQRLLQLAGVPIAAPSANRFGRLSPTRAEHVIEQLGDRVDYVLDGGPCEVGVESTVLDLTVSPPRMLRPGGVTWEELQNVIGEVVYNATTTDDANPAAPGMLSKHYAPETRVVLVDHIDELPRNAGGLGVLTFEPLPQELSRELAAVEVLSPSGDLREAAANFFAALRRLDQPGISQIIALRFPEEGLGRTLNNRLQRAANSHE